MPQYLIGRRFISTRIMGSYSMCFSAKDPPNRIVRWLIKLQDYGFDILYQSGKTNADTDALSRLEGVKTARKTKGMITTSPRHDVAVNLVLTIAIYTVLCGT